MRLAFACDIHSGDLIAAKPLLQRDRDAVNRRRDKLRPGTAERMDGVLRRLGGTS